MLAQRGQNPYNTGAHRDCHETPFLSPPHQITSFVYARVCVYVCVCVKMYLHACV